MIEGSRSNTTPDFLPAQRPSPTSKEPAAQSVLLMTLSVASAWEELSMSLRSSGRSESLGLYAVQPALISMPRHISPHSPKKPQTQMWSQHTSQEKDIARRINNRLRRRQIHSGEDPTGLLLQARDTEVEMHQLVEQHRPLRLPQHNAHTVTPAREVADAVL